VALAAPWRQTEGMKRNAASCLFLCFPSPLFFVSFVVIVVALW